MYRVLIVEDERYAREALVKQIREYDTAGEFNLYQASNGEEGMLIFEKERPELVLTDIRMPRMDGLKLLEGIREKDSKAQVVILSAYSDFEYARSALTYGASDYLLKPIKNEDLSQCLDKFVQKNRSEKKEDLITGRDMVSQFIISSVRHGGHLGFVEVSMFRKFFPSYQFTVVRFPGKRPDEKDFLAVIEKSCGNGLLARLRFLELDAGIWVLVVAPSQEHSFFQRKVRRVMQEEGYLVSMGISRVYQAPVEVGAAYREALETLKYKIYGPDIYYAEKLKGEEMAEYYLSKDKESALREALKDGNERKAKEVIGDIFAELSALLLVKAECLELLYSRLTNLFKQAIGESGLRQGSWGREQAGILRFEDIREMEEFLLKIAGNICRMGRGRDTGGKKKDIVELMADYAREHYDQEVSVKILAEKVLFMNQDYLSHLFAEKKGISFSAYLRRIRMGQARGLLGKGRYSVTEVASMVGYNDTSQFIRFFKQETGMTPKKYQTSLRDTAEWPEREDKGIAVKEKEG